jgi:uncharacterized protein YxjI
MYGILQNDRLREQTLEDTLNGSVFKLLFGLNQAETVCSSISERWYKIDSNYFKQIYECVYEQFSNIYSISEQSM